MRNFFRNVATAAALGSLVCTLPETSSAFGFPATHRTVTRSRVFRPWTGLRSVQFHRSFSRNFEQSSHVSPGVIHSETSVTISPGVVGENQGTVCPPSGPCVDSKDTGKPLLPLALPPKGFDDIWRDLEQSKSL